MYNEKKAKAFFYFAKKDQLNLHDHIPCYTDVASCFEQIRSAAATSELIRGMCRAKNHDLRSGYSFSHLSEINVLRRCIINAIKYSSKIYKRLKQAILSLMHY